MARCRFHACKCNPLRTLCISNRSGCSTVVILRNVAGTQPQAFFFAAHAILCGVRACRTVLAVARYRFGGPDRPFSRALSGRGLRIGASLTQSGQRELRCLSLSRASGWSSSLYRTGFFSSIPCSRWWCYRTSAPNCPSHQIAVHQQLRWALLRRGRWSRSSATSMESSK